MTKQESQRRNRMFDVLRDIGFTQDEAEKLRRISTTLRRWHELECGTDNGCIERDEGTGKAYWLSSVSGKRFPIADRETGARKRLASIVGERNKRIMLPELAKPACLRNGPVRGLQSYIQGDPRGAALYILRPGDIPEGQTADSCYSRGICVY